jgi:hypothetical protein
LHELVAAGVELEAGVVGGAGQEELLLAGRVQASFDEGRFAREALAEDEGDRGAADRAREGVEEAGPQVREGVAGGRGRGDGGGALDEEVIEEAGNERGGGDADAEARRPETAAEVPEKLRHLATPKLGEVGDEAGEERSAADADADAGGPDEAAERAEELRHVAISRSGLLVREGMGGAAEEDVFEEVFELVEEGVEGGRLREGGLDLVEEGGGELGGAVGEGGVGHREGRDRTGDRAAKLCEGSRGRQWRRRDGGDLGELVGHGPGGHSSKKRTRRPR